MKKSVHTWRALFTFACLSPLLAARAQYWTTNKLNNAAVTNAAGALVVLGTEGSYNNSPTATKEAAFDGNTATFFDPLAANAQNAWAGFELRSPKVVTRIRYVGRSGQAARMNGVLFQTANSADFSDAVTLHSHTPPANWTGTTWIDVTLNSTTNVLRACRYVRFIATAAASYGGNMAECEFYGMDAQSSPPPTPALSFADSANWYASLRWTVDATALAYEVQRRRADEPDFAPVYTNFYSNAGSSTWRDPVPLFSSTDYRIRARNSAGDSAWLAFTAAAYHAATGTWIGTAGTYGNNMTGDKVFDANIDTFFDGPAASNGNGLWAGLDLGAPRAVVGLRFTPRPAWASRMTGGLFQGADNPDFTGATTLHTVSPAPHYTNMTVVALTSPATFRYVRYLSPNGGWGNVSEVEFDLAASAPKTPLGLSVASSDITNDFPVLSWSFDTHTTVSSSLVYRATAPGGPYTPVTPQGVAVRSWTDTSALVGVLYFYRVSAVACDAYGWFESPPTASLSYRRCQRLERDWATPTTLKAGISAFRIGTVYNNQTATLDVDKLFDGSLATFADITPSACSVGLDLGKPYGVGWLRFSPRATYAARVNGAVLRGSNDLDSATTLAPFANAVAGAYTVNRTTASGTYRYVFATRLDGAEFYGNLAELELYGWDPDTLPAIMTAPLSVTITRQAAALALSWSAATHQTAYRVERMPADASSGWTEVGTTTDTALADANPIAGVRYLYRVASTRTGENGEETAYSDSYPAIFYTAGSGTGLKGHYCHPFTKAFDPAQNLVLTRTDPTVDFTWGGTVPLADGTPSSLTNTCVTWYGKLLVPHSGTYTFHAVSDDGAALSLDGQYVLNDWSDGAYERSGSATLTAGEHLLRLDYFQGGGGASVRLDWSGAVLRETIPASQLLPLDLPPDTISGWQGRTFNASRLGAHTLDQASGGITVGSSGVDLSGAAEGHHFIWKTISGPFLLEAKVTQQTDVNALSAKALLMIRTSLVSGSPFLAPARMATGQLGYKARLAEGGTITDLLAWQGTPTNPCWLRVKRRGNTFTTSFKNTGGDWTDFHTYVDTNGVFNTSLVAGFSVTSPTTTSTKFLQTATFSEIRLTPLYGTILLLQ